MSKSLFSSVRGGIERETTGILMWSKVYTLQTPTGKEVAIALVDTQVKMIPTFLCILLGLQYTGTLSGILPQTSLMDSCYCTMYSR
jgi:hypothetical protein